jgi:hypothetical protein
MRTPRRHPQQPMTSSRTRHGVRLPDPRLPRAEERELSDFHMAQLQGPLSAGNCSDDRMGACNLKARTSATRRRRRSQQDRHPLVLSLPVYATTRGSSNPAVAACSGAGRRSALGQSLPESETGTAFSALTKNIPGQTHTHRSQQHFCKTQSWSRSAGATGR